ncbi:MAG TPA: rod shape-determining protein MreD [Bacteroidota bacterium]|nr:rod shape-determining protein MreD [Bacteroidota bacterium]HRT67144.1 rod shape-determining protein MreD [Bacteroidota bacterium]
MQIPELNIRQNPYWVYIKYILIGLLLSFLQITFVPLIEIAESLPNLVFLYAVWLTLRYGRFVGFISAFLLGLIYDAFSLQLIGVSSLSFLFGVFFASFWYKKDKEFLVLNSYIFILIVFASCLIANLIQNLFYLRMSELEFLRLFILKWLGSTVYTSVLSSIIVFINLSKKR